MALSWIAATVMLASGQTAPALTPKKIGETGLTLSLPAGEIKPADGNDSTLQTYRFEGGGVELIITYKRAPEGVLADPDFAANAAGEQLPGKAEEKPLIKPIGVSGLQARRITRGTLAAAVYIQAGEQSWRILSRVKDVAATKTRDAILSSASIKLDLPQGWLSMPLKDSKVTVALPRIPDISFGSVPDMFRMSTYTVVVDEAIITITQLQSAKGKGPTLSRQESSLDADLQIPIEAQILKKVTHPIKISGIDGIRVEYEFKYGSTGGVFTAMLLARGDETWRILIARKRADSAGANVADSVLNSLQIAK